jgi:hypothetical protein
MMCVGTEFALVGLDLIASTQRRMEVAERLGQHGRAVVDLTYEQVCAFAGNAIELRSTTGRVLAMSSRGLASLRPEQREAIEASCRILPLDVPTIELAGGSVRCMIVGVHLDPRPTAGPAPAAEVAVAAQPGITPAQAAIPPTQVAATPAAPGQALSVTTSRSTPK